MQWSLKSLLIATAIVPLAIFAIAKSTPIYVSAVLTVAAIAWIAIAIMAWIDTGSRQAWARGVILAATAYGLLVVWMGTEFELAGSRLATSGALYYAHAWTAPNAESPFQPMTIAFTSPNGTFVNSEANFDITTHADVNTINGFSGTVGAFRGLTVLTNQSPTRSDFAVIGQVYWSVLFGLVGGWFAAWIERRKKQEAAS